MKGGSSFKTRLFNSFRSIVIVTSMEDLLNALLKKDRPITYFNASSESLSIC